MRAAVIDCGTNTFHLLVADYKANGQHCIIVNKKINVKLGEGRILHNEIAPLPFERGLKAFSELLSLAKEFNPDITQAFATSAIRGASNGNEFTRQVFDKTGIQIQVIDGQREAQLIYKGVKLALDELPGTSLIMDIGGGSTEFIITSNNQIIWKHSFELGVSRLIQKFRPSDPVTSEDIATLENFFSETLKPLEQQLSQLPASLLVGCSGSFESLASMIQQQIYSKSLPDDIKSYSFNESDFRHISEKLLLSDESQRLSMQGLVKARVDTIVYATIFIDFIKNNYNIPLMIFSNYALKEGVLAELIEKSNE